MKSGNTDYELFMEGNCDQYLWILSLMLNEWVLCEQYYMIYIELAVKEKKNYLQIWNVLVNRMVQKYKPERLFVFLF
jgi:hypothetical protein